jgi:hypothetical protein
MGGPCSMHEMDEKCMLSLRRKTSKEQTAEQGLDVDGRIILKCILNWMHVAHDRVQWRALVKR